MAIPKEVLEDIKLKTDLVALVGKRVALRQRGKNWVGLCPFHEEQSPSFNVNPQMGIWKCFGCKEAGNAFGWLQKASGMSFYDSVEALARDAGVELPDGFSAPTGPTLTMDDAMVVLTSLGVSGIDFSGGKLKASCPLSKWRHEKQTDQNPSFAVLHGGGGRMVGRCLACGFKGSLQQLVLAVQFSSGKNLSALMSIVGPQDSTMATRIARMGGQKLGAPTDKLTSAHASAVRAWDSAIGLDKIALDKIEYEVMSEDDIAPHAGSVPGYALERGIELDTCREWGLGHDKRRKRLLFPVRNHRGELVGVTGRKYDSAAWGPKYLHSKGRWRSMVFYGEDHLDLSARRAFLVEGSIDVLRVSQAGVPNVIGMLGSWLGKIQRQKLEEWFDEVVVIPDGDKAGREMAERVKRELGGLTVRVIDTPDGKDPADLEPEQLMRLLSEVGLTFPG